MVRVFARCLGDWGSIPGWVIPKTQKMVLDTSLLNIQHSKVGIKGKVEQSRERSNELPDTFCIVAIEKRAFGSLLTMVTNFTYYIYIYIYIYIQISLNIIDILCLHIFFWIRSNSRITFIVFGGIDLCIVHSCMYP